MRSGYSNLLAFLISAFNFLTKFNAAFHFTVKHIKWG